MMLKNTFIAILFLLPCISMVAQREDVWEVYMAQYEKGPGSVTINMSLKSKAPAFRFPYVLVTGVTYKDCQGDGFPTKAEFNKLDIISDSVQALIKNTGSYLSAGTFTHQCERLHYYYISDTQQVRSRLEKLYKNRFSGYKPYINIKEDKKWEYYLAFLYPNEQTRIYMANSKMVMRLQKAGDKLVKARKVNHWIYFYREKEKNEFIMHVTADSFEVDSDSYFEATKKYMVSISRYDKVDLVSINELTERLRKMARQYYGIYQNWETFLIKD